jgi:hypothetical protein
MTVDHSRVPVPATVRAAAALALAGALAAALMAVAHLGIDLPLLPTVGAGRPVPPATAAFGVGTLLFALTAGGLARAKPWSWPLGLTVNALTLASCAMPYRGPASAVGIVMTAAAIVLLLLPSARRAVLGSPAP